MDTETEYQVNQAAFLRLRDELHKQYRQGRFVAISAGQIVGDAATFDELNALLNRQGISSRDTLVVQAGVHYPDYVEILLSRLETYSP